MYVCIVCTMYVLCMYVCMYNCKVHVYRYMYMYKQLYVHVHVHAYVILHTLDPFSDFLRNFFFLRPNYSTKIIHNIIVNLWTYYEIKSYLIKLILRIFSLNIFHIIPITVSSPQACSSFYFVKFWMFTNITFCPSGPINIATPLEQYKNISLKIDHQ